MEALIHPPRSLMEVFDMLPEGTLAELINNRLSMSPAPLSSHQKVLFKIAERLVAYVDHKHVGEVIIAPFDVKLDETRNVVQPDITVILKTNSHQIVNGRYSGVPDLIVEILSPGNKDHDLITKKDLYEKFGVKEYWIIDPETKLALGFSLTEKKFIKIGDSIGRIDSLLLQVGFEF
ncbi:MAG: Uma2 family endonuclease [Cyclobacteriaceae bacterium]|nr:Uma2 family endonuclease [Cyclobacteriaceae bacterium]